MKVTVHKVMVDLDAKEHVIELPYGSKILSAKCVDHRPRVSIWYEFVKQAKPICNYKIIICPTGPNNIKFGNEKFVDTVFWEHLVFHIYAGEV